MKKTTLWTLLLTTWALTGCMDNNDVYDPSKVTDEGKVTDLIVPEGFDWSTTRQVSYSVEPAGKKNHTCIINIYSQHADAHSLPLACGIARKGAPFSGQLTLAAGDTLVSIVQELRYKDGTRAYRQTQHAVKGNRILPESYTQSTTAGTRSLGETRIGQSEWDSAEELENNGTASGNVKVSAGKATTLGGFKKGATIYVAGTLVLPDDFKHQQEGTIVVLSRNEKKALGIDDGEAGQIMGVNADIKNDFTLINGGTIHLSGTLTVGNGASVTTSGCIFADRLELDGNGNNGSQTDKPTTYTIADNGCTQVKSMSVQKAEINLGYQAYLYIEGELNFKNSCEIIGDEQAMDSGYSAVIQAGSVTKDNSNNGLDIDIDRKVLVVCEEPSVKPDEGFTLNGGSAWGNLAGAAEDNVSIPASDCSEGFHPGGGTSGVDPDPDITGETTLGTYTYAFEDLWPSYGDYDMNDLVLKVNPIIEQNSEGRAVGVRAVCTITAIGASNRIAAAVRWTGIQPEKVSSVSYSTSGNLQHDTFQLASNGTEKQQSQAVIPLFDDAHALAGQSGICGTTPAKAFPAKEFTVTVRFTEGLNPALLAINQWDCFIGVNASSGKRLEVHLIDQTGTDLFDYSLAAGGEASSSQTPFRSQSGFCWAMCIADEFPIPLESENLREVFPEFEEWVTSGGQSNPNWYKNPRAEKVMP